MITNSYLEKLLGKVLVRTQISTTTTVGITIKKEDLLQQQFSLIYKLYFDDYLLIINNPISIIPSNISINDLVNNKIIIVNETKDEAELVFENGSKLVVNLREEAFYDPEAMSLMGPNNFCVVWN